MQRWSSRRKGRMSRKSCFASDAVLINFGAVMLYAGMQLQQCGNHEVMFPNRNLQMG